MESRNLVNKWCWHLRSRHCTLKATAVTYILRILFSSVSLLIECPLLRPLSSNTIFLHLCFPELTVILDNCFHFFSYCCDKSIMKEQLNLNHSSRLWAITLGKSRRKKFEAASNVAYSQEKRAMYSWSHTSVQLIFPVFVQIIIPFLGNDATHSG